MWGGDPLTWPSGRRAGIRYGNLSEADLARLPPFMQQHLPDRAMAEGLTSNIVDAGAPELVMADPVLPPAPHGGPVPQAIQLPQLYGSFSNFPLSIGTADQLVLSIPPGDSRRIYLFVINTHPLQDMFLSFAVGATTGSGIPIVHNFGFVEYNIVVPQDDIHLIANGLTTTGVLAFSNKPMNEPAGAG